MSHDKPIKVLHVTFDMTIGGAQQVIRQLVTNMDKNEIVSSVACIDNRLGELGDLLEADGVSVTLFDRQPGGLDWQLIKALRRHITNNRIDIVHCHQYTPYFYGALASIGTGIKLIFTEHGRFFPDRHNRKRRIINPLLALFTDHITAISKATADATSRYEYIPRDRIEVVYNGIGDLAKQSYSRAVLAKELGLPADHTYIGTISRLEPIKNQLMMIKAFDEVNKSIPETRLLLIGDGSARARLEERVEALNLQDKVIFTGSLDQPQRFLSLLEIFLLSSFSEGTSMTLLESMCFSIPCVVTEVGGNPEIVVENETGRLVKSDDEVMFARVIIELLENKPLREKFGTSGRKRFDEKFTASAMIDSYQALYLK